MTDSDDPERAIQGKGAEPSIIESFSIDGLYGYRSIALNAEYAATILIAKNGTGKTTLLGALDAFLRLQLSRLRNVEFSEIRCRLRGEADELILTYNDVIAFLQVPTEGEIITIAGRSSLEPSALQKFIMEEFDVVRGLLYPSNENKTFDALLTAYDFNRREIMLALSRVRVSLMERQPAVAKIFAALDRTLKGVDIVYLPTYRRVEAALRGDPRERPYRKRRPKFEIADGSLFTGEIQFGLSDISERLSDMNQDIILKSNSGYREISANIINELIDGSFESDVTSEINISSEELKLFFERIESGERQRRYTPISISIPNLERIYTREGVPSSSGKFLNYFLAKLATVIRSTKDLELPVDEFIKRCNKYLDSVEPSTAVHESLLSSADRLIDGKELRLNRSNLRVHVVSLPEGRKISLDALLSGEKQMISLFARLYLYPGRKIVLIDEPELSLSMDWQREILVDVINAPLCSQVIAITHSPFVFDNELEPFARSLKLGRIPAAFGHEQEAEADIDV